MKRLSVLAVLALALSGLWGPCWAGFAGTDIYLPSVGSAVGVAPWYTTVWVYNPNSSPAVVTFYLLKRQPNPSPSAFTDTIPPGDVKRYDDAVQFMFHEATFGALRVVADQKVLVSSRIYSQKTGEGLRDSKGQYFGGIPASFAIGPGEKTRIVGVRQTSGDKNVSDFRFNLGVVETTGSSCTVTLRLLDETGAPVGSPKTWSLGAREAKQDSLWNLFAVGMENHQVEVEVTGGSGKVIAFGSSVANGSDDPSTVEMHFADALLAENASGGSGTITGVVAGAGLTGGGSSGTVTLNVGAGPGIQVNADSVQIANGGVSAAMLQDTAAVKSLNGLTGAVTLAAGSNVTITPSGQTLTIAATGGGGGGGITGVTAGAGLTGGGSSGNVTLSVANNGITSAMIATGAVSKDKLSATGGSDGQVLKLSGGALTWGTDQQGGLTLPYSGSVSSSSAFAVTNSGSGTGVDGVSSSGIAVRGLQSTSGSYGHLGTTLNGVYGWSSSGQGVYGQSSSGTGVFGESSSNVGVYGRHSSSGSYGYLGGSSYGVYGASSSGNYGYLGGSGAGVYGKDNASGNYGFIGFGSYGVLGSSSSGAGVYGNHSSSGNYGYLGGSTNGVYGYSSSGNGVRGVSSSAPGVFGQSTSSSGVYGESSSLYGVYGTSSTGYAGYFNGKVHVNGQLTKTSGSFKIDHPLDPEGKYLYHSFVESPDMMNIYNGNVVLDENGEAWVELPEWFEALNRDFRYQLTCIGGFAPVYIAEEIQNNRFKIAGGKPGMKVSWQVTGIRHDPWAEAHRIPVEEVKPPEERGTYLHPELYGQPEEKSVDWKHRQQIRELEPVPASASPEKP